jgi:hypothetical protein
MLANPAWTVDVTRVLTRRKLAAVLADAGKGRAIIKRTVQPGHRPARVLPRSARFGNRRTAGYSPTTIPGEIHSWRRGLLIDFLVRQP